MLERLSKADKISLGGAVLLLIALFLPWYGGEGAIGDVLDQVGGDLASFSAFEAFEVADIILLLLAAGAGTLIVLVAMGKVDASFHRFVEIAGEIAAIMIVLRIIFQPDLLSPKWGIFVGLIGAAAIAGGQLLDRMGKL